MSFFRSFFAVVVGGGSDVAVAVAVAVDDVFAFLFLSFLSFSL